MIVEHRTYTVQPGRVPEYLANYEQYGMPVQLPILGNMIGFFHTVLSTASCTCGATRASRIDSAVGQSWPGTLIGRSTLPATTRCSSPRRTRS